MSTFCARSRSRAMRPAIDCLEQRDCPTTLVAVVNAVASDLKTAVNNLVVTVAKAEITKPTLLAPTIRSEIGLINSYNQHNQYAALFNELAKFGVSVITEGRDVVARRLPRTDALLDNVTVDNEVVRISGLKSDIAVIANYIATHKVSVKSTVSTATTTEINKDITNAQATQSAQIADLGEFAATQNFEAFNTQDPFAAVGDPE
jgi:hypothetical protein